VEAGNGQGREGNERAVDRAQGASSRQSRRRGVFIGGAIAFGLLFLTVGTIALVLVAGPGGQGGGGGGGRVAPVIFKEKYVSGAGADKIAVLPVSGLIGPEDPGPIPLSTMGVSPETVRDQLRQAAEDERVKAVIFEVNSPGGGVVPTDQIHENIREFKETTDKPVVVSMDATAASGGYYIATAADRIVANANTLTGSLGVIFSYLNFEEAADKLGLQEEVVKSGPYKDLGSSIREPTEEELEILQTYVDEGYDRFVQVIVEGRDLPEEEVRELADGRVYSGLQAESLGLVDELGDLEKAAETSRELAGVEKATVVRYQRPSPGLAELLGARLASPEPEAEALKVLKSVGLSPTPELQYLYRP
jgi:protease-4